MVGKLTKSFHFLADSTNKSSRLFREILRLQGVTVILVSDRGSRSLFRFWGGLQKAKSTNVISVLFFTIIKNGRSKHIVQALEDMLRGYF